MTVRYVAFRNACPDSKIAVNAMLSKPRFKIKLLQLLCSVFCNLHYTWLKLCLRLHVCCAFTAFASVLQGPFWLSRSASAFAVDGLVATRESLMYILHPESLWARDLGVSNSCLHRTQPIVVLPRSLLRLSFPVREAQTALHWLGFKIA